MNRHNTWTGKGDLTSDPVQIDYSLLLYRYTGCPWHDGDLNERGRAGGMEVLVVAATNEQVPYPKTIRIYHILTIGMV